MITVHGLVLCLALALPTAEQTDTLTLDRLASILTVSTREPVGYEELRESPWLERRQHSYGTMYVFPDFLEKRVEFPQHEIWRLYSDHIVRVSPAGEDHQEVVFGDSAKIAVFANAFQYIVAGQVRELESDFHLNLTGNESDWSVKLKPRSSDVQRYLEQIEVRGNGAALREIIVLEPGGDRTTTQFVGSRN